MHKKNLAIGLDLGGSFLKAGVVDEAGIIIRSVIVPSQVENGYEAVKGIITKSAQGYLEDFPEIRVVGLSAAGLVDFHKRILIASPNCPSLVGRPLGEDLELLFGKRLVMLNDANAVAIGEGRVGAARGVENYIVITLGTGVGGAAVLKGKIVEGEAGMGGELGHIPVSLNGPKCGCGGRGCLESYIGKKGLDRFIGRKFPHLKDKGMRELARMASHNVPEAIQVFHYLARILGIALAGLVNIFAPEVIVIGGGISLAGDTLFSPLRKEVQRRAYSQFTRQLKITPAQLGNWAGVIGAALIALESQYR